MPNFTNQKIKLDHDKLLQKELDLINSFIDEELPEEPTDCKKTQAVRDLSRYFSLLTEEEKIEEAKGYQASYWKCDDRNMSYLCKDDNDVYTCLYDGDNKSNLFPKHIQEINYSEPTNWCKVVDDKGLVLYMESKYFKLAF